MEAFEESACSIKTSPDFLRWVVCFSAALFPFYDFIQMNMFNAISSDFIKAFHLSSQALGNISAFYLYSTVMVIFPIGILLDRVSTRKMLIMAVCISLTGTLLFSFSTNIMMAEISRFIAGIGGSFSFLTVIMLATRWFPATRTATVIGMIVTVAMLGGVVAQTPLTLLVDKVGWRQALWIDAAFGVMILSVIWRNVKDYPPDFILKHKSMQAQRFTLGLWKSIKLALKSRQSWLCAGYTSLLNLPILLLGAVWGSGYLTTVHFLSRQQATYVTSMIFIGTIIGSSCFGWWSDYLRLRRFPMIIGAIFSFIIMLSILYLPELTLGWLIILFLLLGICTSSQVLSYPVIAESNSPLLTGANEGVAAAVIMSGGAIFQPFFGWLLEKNEFLHTVPDYKTAMLIFPMSFFIGLIFSYFIKETYCKPSV